MADSKDPYNSLPAIPDCLDGDMTAAGLLCKGQTQTPLRARHTLPGRVHTIKLDKATRNFLLDSVLARIGERSQ